MGYYIRWAPYKITRFIVTTNSGEPEYIFQLLFLLNSYISLKDQAQTENVRAFWLEAEFVVEHSVAGNKVHKLLNNQRLNFIDSLNNSIGSLVDYVDGEKDEKDGDYTEGNEKERSLFSVEKSTGSRQAHNNSKQKLDNQLDYTDYEGLAFLFDESNEEALMESIDEKTLAEENKLSLMREEGQSQYMHVEAF
ncbi:10400_t:CDS:2 [Paraglomus brasilianum]|uniref:10400_t:CDS:1 n=1 Tax=Paraglomus brasilianum TaxID=144538 RepID=A0A9N9BS66_9GLOM|nr:10400_t:CDS:2 [Paraglomus brasilianum]